MEVSDLIIHLYEIVNELKQKYNRPFTPDGHLLGSIGECLIADKYGLILEKPSVKGYDAKDKSGKRIQIKVTQSQGTAIAFRNYNDFDAVIIGVISESGRLNIIYAGSAKPILEQLEKIKENKSNGQKKISVRRIKELYDGLPESERIREIMRNISEEDEKVRSSYNRKDLLPLIELLPSISNSKRYGDLIFENNDRPAFPYYDFDPIVSEFIDLVYRLNLIIVFNWSAWEDGKKIIADKDFNYHNLSMMEICKIITLIVRGDRFNEGLLISKFEDGSIEKIIRAIENLYR